jgi:hypothetical protein
MACGRTRVNSPGLLASFLDSPDDIYGSGADSSVTISGNTTLSSDMYYYDLTVNANITLNTGGYRVFVKNILTMGSSAVIGLPGGSVALGTLKGGGAAGANTTNSLGGSGASATATQVTAAAGGSAYYRHPSQAVRGYNVTASATTPTYLEGGAGGTGVGGGVVIVCARYISTSAACTISATGGADAGGGVIIFVSSNDEAIFNTQTHLTLDVSKGTGTGSDGTAFYIEVD